MNAITPRRASLIGALTLGLILAGCETAPPPPPPAPPPPPLPAVALNSGVAEAAAIYLAYVQDASQISSSFANGDEVRASLMRAATYEPVQLSRGMVAYAAVVALQSPEFVNGVRGLAADPANRDTLLRQIMADPAYAAQLPGAREAAGLIAAQIQSQGQGVYNAGAAVKQTAYDIQRQRWSSQHVTDREERLERARLLSATPLNHSVDDSARLLNAALTGQGLALQPAEAGPPYTQAVVRGLAIAALAALGQAGEDARATTESLLNEPVSADCLNFSKLMMMQCLAASRPHYEEIFCLGQHIMMDTAQCVVDAAGTVTPILQLPVLMAQPASVETASADATSSDAQTPN